MSLNVKGIGISLLCVGLLAGCGTQAKTETTSSKPDATTAAKSQNNNQKQKEVKPFSVLKQNLPFAQGTFDSGNTINPDSIEGVPEPGSVIDFDVLEKGSKTEVIWEVVDEHTDEIEPKVSKVSVYRTVSDKNGWGKSEKLGTFNSNVDIIGHTLYVSGQTDKSPITQIIYDNNGKIQSQNAIPSGQIVYGYTDKGRAIAIDNKIYTSDGTEAPIQVQDKYNLFASNYGFYLNEKSSKLYVFQQDKGLLQFNAKTGEPLYNSEGKEASFGDYGVGSFATLIGGFGDTAIYDQFEANTSSASENITAVTSKAKQLVGATGFSLPAENPGQANDYLSRIRTTQTKDEVHFWRIVAFEHKPVLKEIIAGKGLEGPVSTD